MKAAVGAKPSGTIATLVPTVLTCPVQAPAPFSSSSSSPLTSHSPFTCCHAEPTRTDTPAAQTKLFYLPSGGVFSPSFHTQKSISTLPPEQQSRRLCVNHRGDAAEPWCASGVFHYTHTHTMYTSAACGGMPHSASFSGGRGKRFVRACEFEASQRNIARLRLKSYSSQQIHPVVLKHLMSWYGKMKVPLGRKAFFLLVNFVPVVCV